MSCRGPKLASYGNRPVMHSTKVSPRLLYMGTLLCNNTTAYSNVQRGRLHQDQTVMVMCRGAGCIEVRQLLEWKHIWARRVDVRRCSCALIKHTLAAGQLIQIIDMHGDHGSGRPGPALCGDSSTGYAKPGHVYACTKTLPCKCPQLRTARGLSGRTYGAKRCKTGMCMVGICAAR